MNVVFILLLVCDDLQVFVGYLLVCSSVLVGDVWFNVNELVWVNLVDVVGGVWCYLDLQLVVLCEWLVVLYGCVFEQLLIGCGSDEVIDLLVCVLCELGCDVVVIILLVFGMYVVCVWLQNVLLVEVLLIDCGDVLDVDIDVVIVVVLGGNVKLVFLCLLFNLVGSMIVLVEIECVVMVLQGRVLVVVDEVYGEYVEQLFVMMLLSCYDNIVVLWMLFKVYVLVVVCIGSLIVDVVLIQLLCCCQVFYLVLVFCVDLVLVGFELEFVVVIGQCIVQVKVECVCLQVGLVVLFGVVCVYFLQGNYLFVCFVDVQVVFDVLFVVGVVVCDQCVVFQFGDVLCIIIGSLEQNDCVFVVLIVWRVVV